MVSPLRVYGDVLTVRARRQPDRVNLRFRDGSAVPLALARWLAPADETDEIVLTSVRGPVLDVGCGPGRHLHVLARRGVFALGVDLSDVAVAIARNRGGRAIVGSIFDELPGAGTWKTALLLDGNIGIGGSPARLLSRIRRLLSPSGEVVVELDSPDVPTAMLVARLETAATSSEWFRWARVSVDDIDAVAGAGGYEVLHRVHLRDRWFARLRRSATRNAGVLADPLPQRARSMHGRAPRHGTLKLM